MSNSRGGLSAASDGAADSGVYGIGWIGLLAAAAGGLIGITLMFGGEGSALMGAATTAVSVALGVLIYLVTKVLDRP